MRLKVDFTPYFGTRVIALRIARLLLMLVAGCTTVASQGQSKPALDCDTDANDHMRAIIRITQDAPKNLKLTDLNSASSWTLYSLSGTTSKTTTRLLITDASITTENTPRGPNTYLAIIFAVPLPDTVNSIQGIVATKAAVIALTGCTPVGPFQKQTQTTEFKAATGKTDSDIYFNGSYTATTGGVPVYSIDSFAGYMHAIGPKDDFWGKLGFYGQVTTKSGSTSPSPNSYLTYAVFQRVLAKTGGWLGPFQTPIFNYRLAGGEFSDQGNNTNFVTSPIVTFPIRFTAGSLGAIRPGLTVPHMTVTAGAEFVNTISSALPEASWITRGLVGATFSAGYAPSKPYLQSVVFTASFQDRFLSSPEVYYNDRYAVTNPKTGKKVTPPRLGTQPRPYADGKLTYNFAKWTGFTFEYSYGSLPPAFVLTHSTFALGLTFTLQQTSYGRYSILKP